MISIKLKRLFFLAIVLFIAHGFEEYFTMFYEVDSVFHFFVQFTNVSPQTFFIMLQLIFWTLLILSLRYIDTVSLRRTLPYLLGLLMLFEATHVFFALSNMNYYPGLLTSLILLLLLVPYTQALLKAHKEIHG